MRRRPPATVITDADENPAEELRRRQTRYVVMMLVRAGCLVLAAVLAMLRVPLLGIWVAVCLAGAVLLPWLAVIWANNKRPKPEYRFGNRFRARPAPAPPAQPTLGHRPEPKIIDADR